MYWSRVVRPKQRKKGGKVDETIPTTEKMMKEDKYKREIINSIWESEHFLLETSSFFLCFPFTLASQVKIVYRVIPKGLWFVLFFLLFGTCMMRRTQTNHIVEFSLFSFWCLSASTSSLYSFFPKNIYSRVERDIRHKIIIIIKKNCT